MLFPKSAYPVRPPGHRSLGDSPSDRCPGGLTGYADFGNNIPAACAQCPKRVEKVCIAETSFVYQGGSKDPGVGSSVLFVVGENLCPRDVQTLGDGVLITPIIAAHPLRL